jgi:hypothetical protein
LGGFCGIYWGFSCGIINCVIGRSISNSTEKINEGLAKDKVPRNKENIQETITIIPKTINDPEKRGKST